MKNIACIIARTNSSRLPKKVLRKVNNIKMIEYIIRKLKKSKLLDKIFLCTSNDSSDSVLVDIAKKEEIDFYCGHPENVLERMLAVGEIECADNLLRITGDNIFSDEVFIDLMLKHHLEEKADYTRTEKLPIGVTAEVMTLSSLKKCASTIDPLFSQYLMLYMFQPMINKCLVLLPTEKLSRPNWSLTVDTMSDWERTKKIIGSRKELLSYDDILKICEEQKIDNLEFVNGGQVKFPADVIMSFEAVRHELENRIAKSLTIEITEGDYYYAKQLQ